MKTYQFPTPGPYNLHFSYAHIQVDKDGQAELDETDKAVMDLVEHFGGKEIKKPIKKQATIRTASQKKAGK